MPLERPLDSTWRESGVCGRGGGTGEWKVVYALWTHEVGYTLCRGLKPRHRPLPTTSSILISPPYPLPNTASSLPRSWTPTVVSACPSQLQWKHYCSVPRAPVGETDKQTEFKSLCAGVSFLASLSLPFLVCNTEILMAVLFPELCEIVSEALS